MDLWYLGGICVLWYQIRSGTPEVKISTLWVDNMRATVQQYDLVLTWEHSDGDLVSNGFFYINFKFVRTMELYNTTERSSRQCSVSSDLNHTQFGSIFTS